MRQYLLWRPASGWTDVMWVAREQARRWAQRSGRALWVKECDGMKAEEAFRLTEANAVPWGLVKANGHDGANRVPKSERQAKIDRLMAMGVDVLIIMGPEFE